MKRASLLFVLSTCILLSLGNVYALNAGVQPHQAPGAQQQPALSIGELLQDVLRFLWNIEKVITRVLLEKDVNISFFYILTGLFCIRAYFGSLLESADTENPDLLPRIGYFFGNFYSHLFSLIVYCISTLTFNTLYVSAMCCGSLGMRKMPYTAWAIAASMFFGIIQSALSVWHFNTAYVFLYWKLLKEGKLSEDPLLKYGALIVILSEYNVSFLAVLFLFNVLFDEYVRRETRIPFKSINWHIKVSYYAVNAFVYGAPLDTESIEVSYDSKDYFDSLIMSYYLLILLPFIPSVHVKSTSDKLLSRGFMAILAVFIYFSPAFVPKKVTTKEKVLTLLDYNNVFSRKMHLIMDHFDMLVDESKAYRPPFLEKIRILSLSRSGLVFLVIYILHRVSIVTFEFVSFFVMNVCAYERNLATKAFVLTTYGVMTFAFSDVNDIILLVLMSIYYYSTYYLTHSTLWLNLIHFLPLPDLDSRAIFQAGFLLGMTLLDMALFEALARKFFIPFVKVSYSLEDGDFSFSMTSKEDDGKSVVDGALASEVKALLVELNEQHETTMAINAGMFSNHHGKEPPSLPDADDQNIFVDDSSIDEKAPLSSSPLQDAIAGQSSYADVDKREEQMVLHSLNDYSAAVDENVKQSSTSSSMEADFRRVFYGITFVAFGFLFT